MCLKSTLDKMLAISQILSQLSVDKINIVGEVYASSKFTTSMDDAMEGADTPLDTTYKRFYSKIIEVFLYILDLILIPTDSSQEAVAVTDNASSYLDMLKNLVSDLTGFSKQEMDESIYNKYTAAEQKLNELKEENLSTQLILCKRAIFD